MQFSCPGNTLRKNDFAEMITLLTSFFEVWTEENFDLSRKLNNKGVETAFFVSRGTFGKKQFFWRFYILYNKLCTWSKNNSDFSRNIAADVSKVFYLSPRNTWRKTYLLKTIQFAQFFWPLSTRKTWLLPWEISHFWAKNASLFSGKVVAELSK